MIPVILSGGSGSRLWPVSRESYPKQFCEFFDQSFLSDTYQRLSPLGRPQIVTLHTMGALTKKALRSLGLKDEELILEPLPKNTAPAIALMAYIISLRGQENEVLGVFPADHLITNTKVFLQSLHLAEQLAQAGHVVTLGIAPRYAATGYGYMEIEKNVVARDGDIQAFVVRQFHEKPTAEKAKAFLESRNYFWNAGIFVFKASQIIELFKKHMPELWKRVTTLKPDLSNLKHVYANLISQSIDYGLMEKLDKIICIPGEYGWSDVGSWDELARLQEESIQIGSEAQVFGVNSEDNFIYSNQRKVVGVCGVNNLIIVDTPDALLVTRKGASQSVKNLVDAMREAKLPEATEHRFEVRPWGGFEILSDDPDHKVKRLFVDPGAQLSYQSHKKRDENWVVIRGIAEVTLNDHVRTLKLGEAIFIPREAKHRLKNPGIEPLTILEVQTGDYFGEDDIQRFKDDYNRV